MRLKQLCIWITLTALLQCQAQQEAEEHEPEQQQVEEMLAPSTMSAADPIHELAVEVATEAAAISGMVTAASHMEETTIQDVAEELPMNDSPQSAEAEEAAAAALPEAEPESVPDAPAEPAPLPPDDTIKPTAKPTMRNCYTCSGPQNASCNMQPKLQKLEECKMVANVDNFGCFSLVKPDTKLVMRGCLPDLAEEGQRYCKTHTKYCDICYKPGCNLNRMSGVIRIQHSWLSMSGLVILTSWSVIH